MLLDRNELEIAFTCNNFTPKIVYICDFICFLFGPQARVLFLSIISFFHLLSWLWHPVSLLLGLVEMTVSEFNASESDLHRFGEASQRG